MFGFKRNKTTNDNSYNAFSWWIHYHWNKSKKYELDFFGDDGGNDTTDIDIEAMYMMHVIDGGNSW